MRILLANYNYYPYNFGGSEVYVAALAKHLLAQGENVSVIAAVPDKAFQEHPIIYNDAYLRICKYAHETVTVFGVQMLQATVIHNYSKYSKLHCASWRAFFSEFKFDVLHMQALTAAIGLNLIEAFASKNIGAKIISSFHTAVTCPKGTLAFAKTKRECVVEAEAQICTACVVSTRSGLPLPASKVFAGLLPVDVPQWYPNVLKQKKFISESIAAFEQWDSYTACWIVYSEGIKQNLIRNGVTRKKIYVLRHGIDEQFTVGKKMPSASINFLYSGRFFKLKGIQTLVNAWLKLPQTEGRKLLLTGKVGDGATDLQPDLKKLAERKDVQFLGAKTSSEMAKLYRHAHCVIIPSECVEIGPLVFHEAVACGCNVIASDIGGCNELHQLYAQQSNVFTTGDANDLAKKIEQYQPSSNAAVQITRYQQHFEAVVKLYSTPISADAA